MIIIGSLTVLLIIFLLLTKIESIEPFPQIVSCLVVVSLWASLIMIPINRAISRSEILSFQATSYTIAQARVDGFKFKEISLEKMSVMRDMIKQNDWLARVQYWNKTLFDIWIPDEVDTLKPLR